MAGASSITCEACDREFKWSAKYAGRKVKCTCGASFEFPKSSPTKGSQSSMKFDDSMKTPRRQCPSCGSTMKTGAIICIQCGFDATKGKAGKTAVSEFGEDAMSSPTLLDAMQNFPKQQQRQLAAFGILGGMLVAMAFIAVVAVLAKQLFEVKLFDSRLAVWAAPFVGFAVWFVWVWLVVHRISKQLQKKEVVVSPRGVFDAGVMRVRSHELSRGVKYAVVSGVMAIILVAVLMPMFKESKAIPVVILTVFGLLVPCCLVIGTATHVTFQEIRGVPAIRVVNMIGFIPMKKDTCPLDDKATIINLTVLPSAKETKRFFWLMMVGGFFLIPAGGFGFGLWGFAFKYQKNAASAARRNVLLRSPHFKADIQIHSEGVRDYTPRYPDPPKLARLIESIRKFAPQIRMVNEEEFGIVL